MSEEIEFNIHEAMGFVADAPTPTTENNNNEEELEEDALQQEQTDEEEQSLQDTNEEEVTEEKEKPKQKDKTPKKRILELVEEKNEAKKRAEAAEKRAELLEARLNNLEAKVQPLQNMAAGLDALGVNKQPQQTVDIDTQLTQLGINPDEYDSDGEKRLALRTAQLEAQQRAQQIEQGYATIEEHVYNTVVSRGNEKADLGAIALLINDKAADFEEDYGMSKTEAQAQAKRAILKEAAHKAQSTGQDITDVLIKKGQSLLKRRNIDLPSDKKSVNINNKAREEVSKRAGKPNIDTVNSHIQNVKPSNDFMASLGFAGWDNS